MNHTTYNAATEFGSHGVNFVLASLRAVLRVAGKYNSPTSHFGCGEIDPNPTDKKEAAPLLPFCVVRSK
jgi:hypothetical protein